MAAAKKSLSKGKSKNTTKSKKGSKVVKMPLKSTRNPKKELSTKPPKLGVPKTPYKQSEFFNALAEQSGLGKKEVKGMMESLKSIIKVHVGKGGPGQFTLPGLFKVTSVTKPATKARKGRNPFTGEEIMLKAKPARKVIKVKVLKKFKTELE